MSLVILLKPKKSAAASGDVYGISGRIVSRSMGSIVPRSHREEDDNLEALHCYYPIDNGP